MPRYLGGLGTGIIAQLGAFRPSNDPPDDTTDGPGFHAPNLFAIQTGGVIAAASDGAVIGHGLDTLNECPELGMIDNHALPAARGAASPEGDDEVTLREARAHAVIAHPEDAQHEVL